MKIYAITLALIVPISVFAQDRTVNITRDIGSVTVKTPQGDVVIERIQDEENVITGEFAKTSRACPNFCIQPMTPAEGVRTVGELEVLDALQSPDILVIDSRIRPNYEAGTIPGAINMPYTEMPDRLDELGCEIDFDGFLCEEAKDVLLFCNGPWCGQSPTAIRRIIEKGYPAEKIQYYRGGMQNWQGMGLTIVEGQ